MTIPDAKNWRDIGPTTLEVYKKEFARLKSPMLPDAEAIWRTAGSDSALALAHMFMENKYDTVGIILKPRHHNPMALRPGPGMTVPHGIVKVSNGTEFASFNRYADCISEWRRRISDSTYKGGAYTKTTTLTEYLNTYAPAGDVHPDTGKDNADIGYERTVRSMLSRFAAMEGDEPIVAPKPAPKPESTMPQYPFLWPGVPGGPIIFSFPVHNKIVASWRTQQRPGVKARRPRKGIQHENGNPSALARQDATYLQNGAGGRQASWHGTVDHKEGFADIPGDEITWQAGDGAGPGNYNGISIELSQWPVVYGTPAQWRQARRNAAEMNARLCARLDADPPSNRHKNYMAKNCPQYLNGNATWWSEYITDWWYFYNDERARMSGSQPAPAPTPSLTDEIIKALNALRAGDTVEVIVDAVNVRRGYGTSYGLVHTLNRGEKAVIGKDGDGNFTQNANGYTWINVSFEGGHGWMATGFGSESWVKKIASAPVPAPKPVAYATKSAVPELLATNLGITDMYNTAVAVKSVNEIDFIFVADLIEFKNASKARQYAGDSHKEVKEPYSPGDRAIAAWITQIEDGTFWYLLAGGDDEWVRVKVTDTIRIADAPLLGDDME